MKTHCLDLRLLLKLLNVPPLDKLMSTSLAKVLPTNDTALIAIFIMHRTVWPDALLTTSSTVSGSRKHPCPLTARPKASTGRDPT